MIAYASMYGNTENMAEILAVMLAEAGVKNIHMHNISKTHVSELISDSFKYSQSGLGGVAAVVIAIVITAITWNPASSWIGGGAPAGSSALAAGAAATTTRHIAQHPAHRAAVARSSCALCKSNAQTPYMNI